MKPPAFDYHRPGSVEEATELLGRLGADAKVLAGGQSLMPMLNLRLAAPRHLVDINRVAGLGGVEVSERTVTVGALARQHDVAASPEVAARCPLLPEAIAHVGHRAIRNRGTVAGSVVHGDPAAELPAALVLLDGSVEAVGPAGTRTIAAADLYAGWFETTLRPDELVRSVTFQAPGPGEGSAFLEFSRRRGDFALCAVAARVAPPAVRVVVAGVQPTPAALDATGALGPDGGAALDELASALEPEDDIHASAGFRRHLARVLMERAIARAAARAGEAGDG